MESTLKWQGKMKFSAEVAGHTVTLDAKGPLGDDSGASPKNLLLASIGGCTGMDVVALLKKYRQELKSLSLQVEAPLTEDHPKIFSEVLVRYELEGAVDPDKALEAVRLSMSKFCGVSAMIAKAAPMKYQVILNGKSIGEGSADFP